MCEPLLYRQPGNEEPSSRRGRQRSPRFREEYFGVWGPSAWPLAGSSRWRQAPLQHMVVICSNRRIAVVVAMSGTRRKSNSSGSRSRSSGSISSLRIILNLLRSDGGSTGEHGGEGGGIHSLHSDHVPGTWDRFGLPKAFKVFTKPKLLLQIKSTSL